jgi:hypothetical protein
MADNYELETIQKRQSKIEDAITKLTEISADLNKMIAVHELRLSHQEKNMDSLELILEKRRDEFFEKEKEIYDTIDKENKFIIHKINESYEQFSKKINDLEKMMWVYGGGFAVAAFLLANWNDLIRLLGK